MQADAVAAGDREAGGCAVFVGAVGHLADRGLLRVAVLGTLNVVIEERERLELPVHAREVVFGGGR